MSTLVDHYTLANLSSSFKWFHMCCKLKEFIQLWLMEMVSSYMHAWMTARKQAKIGFMNYFSQFLILQMAID